MYGVFRLPELPVDPYPDKAVRLLLKVPTKLPEWFSDRDVTELSSTYEEVCFRQFKVVGMGMGFRYVWCLPKNERFKYESLAILTSGE